MEGLRKEPMNSGIDWTEAETDLKKLRGLPPYDGPSNICRGDAYFAMGIEKRYGMSISKLDKLIVASKSATVIRRK